MPVKIHFHTEENPVSYGGKSSFLGRKSEISTEERANYSELRNHSSEVSFHSSEEFFIFHVEI